MDEFIRRLQISIYEMEDIRALHMAHVDHKTGFPAEVDDELTLAKHLSVIKQCNDVLAFLNDLSRAWKTLT